MKAGIDILKNHAANAVQTTTALLQEALDKSVLLSFHYIVAQMIGMLCQKNMCAMCCISCCSLHMYVFQKVHGLVYATLVSHIDFHVPTS